MNYYPHHLGDYAKDTGSLTMLEHGAFRLLLDAYYSSERPIPREEIYRVTRAVTPADKKAVDYVLRKFFTLDGEAYRQGRADREIAIMEETRTRAQANGKRGGRPPKQKPKHNPQETQWVISGLRLGSENETQTKAPQTPNTNNPNTKQPQTPEAVCVEQASPGEIPPITLETAKKNGGQFGATPEIAEAWWLDRDKVGWLHKGQPITRWQSDLQGFANAWKANRANQPQPKFSHTPAEPKVADWNDPTIPPHIRAQRKAAWEEQRRASRNSQIPTIPLK